MKYNAHINVKVCTSILTVQYLYKYIYKDHDQVTIILSQINCINNQQLIDEIKAYLDARYISASKSIWRIFYYKIHNCAPNVQRLAVHLLQ